MSAPMGGVEPLSKGWRAAAWALAAGALALAVGGFVNSFSAVRVAVEPSFGPLAWTVPVLVDVGIFVFTGIDLLFTRMRMRLGWLRVFPWSLIGATIWLNVADESTSVGIVAHAAPPVLWVVTVEVGALYLRHRADLLDGQLLEADRIPVARWVLAPFSTLVIRRWMALQKERSFARAYGRWWDRKQAKWELQDTHGPLLWRLRASRKERGFYRYGHLTPHHAGGPAGEPLPELTAGGNGNAPMVSRRPAPAKAANGSGRHAGKRRAELADAESVIAELRADGLPVNRTVVAERLRHDRNLRLSNELADQLLEQLGYGNKSGGDS